MKPDLADPAADVEGVGQANQDVDDIKVSIVVRGEPPRQQGERKQRDAIGRQGNGHIAEPSVAEGHVAVLVVNVETMDLAEEEDGEYQVRELVREHHQPSHILSQPGNEKHEEKGDKAHGQITMEPESLPRKIHLEGLDQDTDGKHDETGQQDAVQHKGGRL